MSALSPRERVLVVDDEEPIRTLLARHLQQHGFETATASDGREALEQLARAPFDLVLSDVRMPGLNGIELLSEIAQRHPGAGVLMLTGCEDVSMAVNAMKNGALDYVLKPFHLDDVTESIRNALDRHRQAMGRAEHVKELEDVVRRQSVELRRVLSDLQEASETTLDALVAALDAREHETRAHSKRVGEYSVYLAQEIGVPADEVEVIRRGAMLHDIGKIGIPDSILLKPGSLSDSEWREMRRHPQIGYWILNGIEALAPASEIVLCHHERWDGLGYPRRLKGDQIVLGARIFSVMDSLDAITSDRPYHKGESYTDARREIRAHSGTQFDPAVVEAYLRVGTQVWSEIRLRTLAETPRALPEIAPLVLT